MQVPDLAGGQLQVAEHDVLDAGAEVALAPRRHLDRPSAEQVQHDRDVVHAQAPERVFVLADHAQVLAVAVHVQHVAELARFDQLTQLDHGRVEPQQVADHHDPRPLGGQCLQLPRLGDRPGQRLLHEHVLSGQQGAPGQGVVGGHRCRHDHRVQRLVLDQVVEASRHAVSRGTAPRTGPAAARPRRSTRPARHRAAARSCGPGSGPSSRGRRRPRGGDRSQHMHLSAVARDGVSEVEHQLRAVGQVGVVDAGVGGDHADDVGGLDDAVGQLAPSAGRAPARAGRARTRRGS